MAIAIGASMAALWFTFTGRGILASVGGGVVQGLAIASMHYTAMAATFYVPLDMPVALSTPLFSQSALAYLIARGMAVVSAGNLVLLGAALRPPEPLAGVSGCSAHARCQARRLRPWPSRSCPVRPRWLPSLAPGSRAGTSLPEYLASHWA